MRLRVPLVLNAGGSILDYVQSASASLKRSAFEEKLRDYLSEQNVTVEMDRTTTNTLFDITIHFLKERSAASDIKQARSAQDWDAQRRIVTVVEKLFLEVKRLAEAKAKIESKPHTSLLAKAILLKINELLRELDDVALLQRGRSSMLPKLMRSAKSTKFYVWELDAYLQHRIPWLLPGQRNLVIAGTMIASGLKSDLGEDHAANSPMARSRANRVMEGEEPFVRWLVQSQIRQVRQSSSRLANRRELKSKFTSRSSDRW